MTHDRTSTLEAYPTFVPRGVHASTRLRRTASRRVSSGVSAPSGEVRSVYVNRSASFIHPLSVFIARITLGRCSRTPVSVKWQRG